MFSKHYPKPGVRIGSQARHIIHNVYGFFSEKKYEMLRKQTEGASSIDVAQQASEATGVSVRTVKNIRREATKPEGFASPERSRPISAPLIELDDFEICAVRRVIHGMHIEGQNVTLDTIRAAVEEKLDIVISRSTLRRRLLQNGFKFRKINRRKILTEKSQVVAARSVYLRAIKRIRNQTPARNIIYLDETWYNQFDMKQRTWLDDKEVSGQKTAVGKGKRLIIVHAGSDKGFVGGAYMCLRTDGKAADYHSNMNSETFEHWFVASLLQNIPARSIIVMDNASYHSRNKSKAPNSGWRKADIQDWLRQNSVQFQEDMRKAELLELARPLRQRKQFVLDQIAAEHGHQVVRLPPYHCDLNPIELVWSNLKSYVRQRNTSGRLQDIQQLLEDSLAQMKPDIWANCCHHVIELEDQYWREDGLLEDINPVVVRLESDDSSRSSSDSDEQ